MNQTTEIATQFERALSFHQSGRLDEASNLYRQILAINSDDADTLNLLGVLLQDTGKLSESIQILSRAVAVDPDFPEAWVNLARAQCADGDPKGAKRSCERAISIDETLPEAHVQLTRALLDLDDHAAASAAAHRAIELDPGSAEAHRLLGHALTILKDPAAAAAAYESADRIEPGHYETLVNLGRVSTDLARFDAARAYCQRAAAIKPHAISPYVVLADALRRANDVEGCADALERALKIAPERADLWHQQGDALAVLGQFQQAADCYNRVLAIDAQSVEALGRLAEIGKLDDTTQTRATLQRALTDPACARPRRVSAGFTLGKLLDRAGEYDQAFEAYSIANALDRAPLVAAGTSFDRIAFRSQIDQLRSAFPRQVFEATKGWGSLSDLPVFIVGMPRSGTTLVEQILASHPSVHGAGERKDIYEILQRLQAGKPSLDPNNWTADRIRDEAETLLARWQDLDPGARRIIDKLPDNVLGLGLIAVLFPNARVILCRRDPLDVCLSCFFQQFQDQVDWSHDLEDCADRAIEIERLAEHWKSVLPLRMTTIDYETLVTDRENETRRLIAFLGLEWDDACLDFHKTDRAVRTASFWQVRQPLFASSVGRWKHYEKHIAPLRDHLARAPDRDDADQAATPRRQSAAVYQAMIDRDPNDVEALSALGRMTLSSGNPADAAALLARAVAILPADGTLLADLARAYRLSGDAARCAEAASAALERNPGDASSHFLLGSALLDLDDPTKARAALENAVRLAPSSRDARVYLAMAHMRLRQFEPAVIQFREALKRNPDDAECLTKLGRVLGELGRHDEALRLLRQAVALAPNDGRVHLGLVALMWMTQDIQAGLAQCELALKVAPDMADLWVQAGVFHAALGRFETAETCYRKALALRPDLGSAHAALATIGLGADTPEEMRHLAGLLADPGVNRDERIGAGHALAKLLDKAGRYDDAWHALTTANGLMAAFHRLTGQAFNADAFDRHVDALINRFTPAFFRANAAIGNPSDLPVFVVGLPRSGTSLVEQIMSSHAEVFGAGELEDIHAIVERLDQANALQAQDTALIAKEAERYLAKLRDLGGSARRVTDKMPDNVQWVGHIATLFPNARIMICRRDYRDIALSCYFQQFGDNLPWSADLLAIASRIRALDRLMAHWRAVLPTQVLEIRYEDLVADLEAHSRRMIDFIGLTWDPACLAFDQTERAVMTASVWQVRQRLFTSSIGRWQHYRSHLGGLLAGLAGLVPSDGKEDWDALAADPDAAMAIARQFIRAGELDFADAACRAMLRRDAGNVFALHLLGVIQRNDCFQALEFLEHAAMLRPDSAQIFADLARVHCIAGNPAAAVDNARRALSIQPDLPDGLLNMGRALSLQLDHDGAIAALRRAAEAAPQSVEIWTTLASAFVSNGDEQGALATWQAALEFMPDDVTLMRGYAGALSTLHYYNEALAMYQAVDERAPGQPVVLYGIAVALMNTGHGAEAAEMCRRGIAIEPDARFWLLLSNCEAMLGHFDVAADACRKALALDPTLTGALRDLTAFQDRSDDQAVLAAARATLADASGSAKDRANAGFSIGHILDRTGEYDDAFAAYAVANGLLRGDRNRRGFVFDRNDFRGLIDRQIAMFQPQMFPLVAGYGDPADLPVFVVGMPRSGTSLVEQILSSHPNVFGAGERTEVFTLLTALENGTPNPPPILWDRAASRREATAYLDLLRDLGGSAVRVVDKQPDNILCLGQIAVLFPGARVIVCRRDPRDICLSCYFQLFQSDALVWTDDLGDCAFRLREIDRLMDHWRKVLPISVLEIDYESIVQNQEVESRRLIDFLGLQWDPACLSFHKTERPVMTASHWQVRQPLYSSSAGRWRHYEAHLQPLFQALGQPKPVVEAG